MRLIFRTIVALSLFFLSSAHTRAQIRLERADLVKFRNYVQPSSSPAIADSTEPFEFFTKLVVKDADSESETVTIKPNGKPAIEVPFDFQEFVYAGSITYPSETALNAGFPDGLAVVSIEDIFNVNDTTRITFAHETWPSVPHISNWSALQSVNPNPTAPIEVKWNASGGDAQTRAQLIVWDGEGTKIFVSPHPTSSDALTASSNSISFNYDGLAESQTYFGELSFYTAASLADPLAPSPFLAAYASRTRFLIETSGAGTGSETPLLVLAVPADKSTDMEQTTAVLFGFDQPMQPTANPTIQWSSNVDSNKFTYIWAPGNTNLLCNYAAPGLPAGQVITWSLNPSGASATLLSFGGTALNTTNGQFTTKAAAVGPTLGQPVIVGANLEIPVSAGPDQEVSFDGTPQLGVDAQWSFLGKTNFPTGTGSFILPLQVLSTFGESTFLRAY